MTSIGLQNPISGSNAYGAFNIFVADPTSSGKAIKGYMPQPLVDVDKTYPDFEQVRFTLKNAWNTTYPSQLRRSHKKAIITPFRAVTNSGDLLSREYYSCGGPCQSFQHRPGMHGLSQRFGANQNTCVPGVVYSSYQLDPKIPAAACNGKYVYDSSDYTTYLKQKAVNKNYNDLSYGGNDSNASQSEIRRIKRY
jgi:hypothetical protein